MKRSASPALCLILLAAVGCSGSPESTSPVCTLEFRYGLSVYVNDSLTGTAIASGASLVVRDGAFKDSVSHPSGRPELNAFPLLTAGERAGTYQISVSKPGYLPWSRSSVRITANECHVNPVSVTALLQPST
jgi:hypothetical protein